MLVRTFRSSSNSGSRLPNRVVREVALPSPHTTEPAGPHEAVQAGEGSASHRSSLTAGSLARRRAALAVRGPGFDEAVLPPPCPAGSVLHSERLLRTQS